MSGNPVRIGDGYATVTGYRLPQPLVKSREGGSEIRNPKSGYRFDCARRDSAMQDQLLRQEKDEASPVNCLRRGSLNAFIPRFAEKEGFFVPRNLPSPHWSLNHPPSAWHAEN